MYMYQKKNIKMETPLLVIFDKIHNSFFFYNLQTLVVGGATLQNPVSWDIGKVTLKFSGTPKVPTTDENEYRYKARPEIHVIIIIIITIIIIIIIIIIIVHNCFIF